MNDIKLLLASSSVYRQQVLKKLRIPFECASPDIDETVRQDESARAYVERLAIEKAKALSEQYSDHWIIGSDQTSVLNGQIRGKPLNRNKAIQQLLQSSGECVRFYTGLCLLQPSSGQCLSLVEEFNVHFRQLSQQEIERYIDLEQPLQCAGSFMVEGLGINLFERLEGRDENSLIGLPLIGLTELMRRAGLEPLQLAK